MAPKLNHQALRLRSWPVLLTVVFVVGVQGLAIGVGAWHFWRYVAAPQLGVLSDADRWEENLRMATSAFRTIDEKQAALETLLTLEDYVRTLGVDVRQAAIIALDNIVLMIDYPLDLKYAAARVQAMLGRGPQARPVAGTAVTASAEVASRPVGADDPQAAQTRLRALVGLRGDAFREASAERTRLLVEAFRRDPCAESFSDLIQDLERREDLGTVERSFLYGMRQERQQRCF
jgi:hypothetical protein